MRPRPTTEQFSPHAHAYDVRGCKGNPSSRHAATGKNITAIFTPTATRSTTYTPYGTVTTKSDITQPIRWSSEYHDPELDLVYYNYRYYNPTDGRWTRRDPIGIKGGVNLYQCAKNASSWRFDLLGLDNYISIRSSPANAQTTPQMLSEKSAYTRLSIKNIKCECSCTERAAGSSLTTMSCSYDLDAVVYINDDYVQEMATTQNMIEWMNRIGLSAREGIYGHEQRHIVSFNYMAKKWDQELAELYNSLLDGSYQKCINKIEDITALLDSTLLQFIALMGNDHAGEQGANPYSPQNATPYEPLR